MYKTCPTRNSYEDALKEGRLIGYKDTLHKINTLEVKEVDLDKEFYKFFNIQFGVDNGYFSNDELFSIAKHFFELGITVNNKAQKGE